MSEQTNTAKKLVERVFSAEENSAAKIEKSTLGKYNKFAIKMFHTRALTPKEAITPAIGEFATKMLEGLDTYRMLYYVNVLKIDMIYVTLILTLIGIYDVLNNPLVGIAYDKTRTRWGKSRPYILLAAIPYYFSTAILYCGAPFLGERPGNDPAKIIFVFTMLFIQETFSTIYSIPRSNLFNLISPNPSDRINVGLYMQYLGGMGASIIFTIFPPLLELNNKGYISFPMSSIFAVMGIIVAAIGCVGNIIMAMKCEERIILQPKPADSLKALFYIFKNKYMLRNFLADFSISWLSNGGYSWDVVTQQEIFGGSIKSFFAYLPYNIVDSASLAFIPKFQKFFKNNNKNALVALRMWDIVCLGGMCIFGLPNVDKQWIILIVYAIFHGINGLNNGPSNVFEAEVSREINDYTEYMTGERPDGSIGIFTGLVSKITAPLNALCTVALFKWSGYDSTIDMLPWSQGSKVVYQKVFFLFIGINLIRDLVRTIPYFFYDLTGAKREKMYVELNERRALLAKEFTISEELESVMKAVEEMETDS